MNEYQSLPDHYYIGHIRVQPNIVLAPMAGVTDSVFRRLLLSLGGLGLVTTEMTNAASISPKALARHRLLEFLPEERPLAMQISGNEPELVASAARQVEALGADILDINCGCPSPKVTGGGHGSALLKDLPKLDRLLRAVRAAVTIPVTLKFRAGWDESSLNYEQTAQIAEAAGVNAIVLHPRTKAQGYSGSADWERIAAAKRAVSIPVIGSGDVVTAEAALERLRITGVDGIMVGRGAMANPWIFRQIDELRHGLQPFQPMPADKQLLLLRYLEMLVEFMPEHHATNKTKQLAGQFFVGLPGAAALRKNLQIAKTTAEQRDVILRYFAPFIDGSQEATLEDEPVQAMEDALVES
ncbi:MAG: tRNA dihydrouridine synthase DusB [Herpetosiphonaceae bacterium]|nr:tRNA dihydrouridine synthase DusB [Herpetosiphonaceae bacterium]